MFYFSDRCSRSWTFHKYWWQKAPEWPMCVSWGGRVLIGYTLLKDYRKPMLFIRSNHYLTFSSNWLLLLRHYWYNSGVGPDKRTICCHSCIGEGFWAFGSIAERYLKSIRRSCGKKDKTRLFLKGWPDINQCVSMALDRWQCQSFTCFLVSSIFSISSVYTYAYR